MVVRTAILLGTALLWSACTLPPADPPAVPDATRFVPPPVTVPLQALPQVPKALEQAPLATLPPPEAVPQLVERPAVRRGKGRPSNPDPVSQAEQGSLLTPTRSGFAENSSSMLRYPYRTGAVYLVSTSPAHPSTLVLPPGVRLAAPPSLDPQHWDVGFAEMGEGDDRQEAVIIRPAEPGLEATTPLLTKSGHLFLLRLRSQDKPGVLAATWELPLITIVTMGGREQASDAGPKIDVGRLHTQYTLQLRSKGPVNWMPVEAYDDGRVTVIRFAESLAYTAAPVLMAVSQDGKQTLPLEYVTYQVPGQKEKGEFYLTRGLYPRLRLVDANQSMVDIMRLPAPAPAYGEHRHAVP